MIKAYNDAVKKNGRKADAVRAAAHAAGQRYDAAAREHGRKPTDAARQALAEADGVYFRAQQACQALR